MGVACEGRAQFFGNLETVNDSLVTSDTKSLGCYARKASATPKLAKAFSNKVKCNRKKSKARTRLRRGAISKRRASSLRS